MKTICTILIVALSWVCYGMEHIKLPAENILSDRLEDLNLEYFNEKASVAKHFSNLECTPSHLLTLFDQMIENFRIACKNDEFGNYNWVSTIQKNKLKILTSILQEHPKAIKFLVDNNLIAGYE